MVRTTYRASRRIISDSEDSDIEENKTVPLKAMKKDESVSPQIPGPSIPRLNFAKIPLTPQRDTNFCPSPIRKVDFSNIKIKTPKKRLQGLRFVNTTTSRDDIFDHPIISCDHEIEVKEDKNIVPEENDLMDQLDLGALTLEDEGATQAEEVICVEEDDEEDVHGILQLSPVTSPSMSLNHLPSSPAIRVDSTPPSEKPSASPVRAITPILVDSDSDAESVIWNPTPHRTPGRRIVVSDSESDSNSPSPCHHDMHTSPIQSHAGPSIPQSTKRKPAALKFIEDEAFDQYDDEEGDYDEEDTLGSLRDFIVDDDDEPEEGSDFDEDEEDDEEDESDIEELARSGDENEDEDEDEDDSDGIEILSTPPLSKKPSHSSRIPDKDGGILHYSPPRKLHKIQLPNLDQLIIASSDSEESDQPIHDKNKKTILTKTKTKGNSEKASFSNKAWIEERKRIANSIFKELDERVFEGKLGPKGVGARVEWNNRLLTTAGVARTKRITKDGQSKKDHWIELSEKVLTGEKQIINTVAHEMCHLATWVISNEFKNPHGRIFNSWGRKVMHARKDIEVTTTHAYTIEYKYKWKCSTAYCGAIYKRHSKSIDITKQTCGTCKGQLVPMFDTKQKTASAFQIYLKENMKYAKSSMPGSSHGEVMRALSKRWNEVGEKGNHEEFWKSVAVAVRS